MRIVVEPAALPRVDRGLLYESDEGAGSDFREQDSSPL